jgi:hypothetical protein
VVCFAAAAAATLLALVGLLEELAFSKRKYMLSEQAVVPII